MRLASLAPAGVDTRLLKSVAVLSIANVLGQGVVVGTYPILTRLFTPSDFGILAVYSAAIVLLAVPAALRYEAAIALPKDETVAVNLLVLSLSLVTATAAFVGIAALLVGHWILVSTHTILLNPYLWMLPFGLFGAGCYLAIANWAIRQQDFVRIARARVVQGAGQAASQLLFGLLRFGPLGLLLGDLFGQWAADGTIGVASLKGNRPLLRQISLRSMSQAARRYRRFPLFSSWAALLNTGGLQLPPILFAILYGPGVAGWFSLSWRAALIPAVFIGEAVSQVYAGAASRMIRDDPTGLLHLFFRMALALVAVGFVPAGLMIIFGPEAFRIVFGDAWRESGVYIQILSLAFLAQFVAGSLSRTLTILERQQWQLVWDACRFTIVVAGLVAVAHLGFSSTVAVAVYSASLFATYVVLFGLSVIALRSKVHDVSAA